MRRFNLCSLARDEGRSATAANCSNPAGSPVESTSCEQIPEMARPLLSTSANAAGYAVRGCWPREFYGAEGRERQSKAFVLLAKGATSNARGGMCNNERCVYREELGILFRLGVVSCAGLHIK